LKGTCCLCLWGPRWTIRAAWSPHRGTCSNATLTSMTTRRETEHQAPRQTPGAGWQISTQSPPEHSKKRPGSSETMGVPENPTSKHRWMIQSWSDEDEEENPTSNLCIPRQRKGVEQTIQEGPLKPGATPSLGMPMASTAAASHVPPPSEGGQSSSGQQGSRGRPCWRTFSAAHHQADM
jgi:hypothetical protein